MAKLQALLFDVDGTIADTEELHRQAFNHAFLRLNLGWEWDAALYTELLRISGGHERLAVYIDRLDVPDGEKQYFRHLIPQIHQTKTHEFGLRLEEHAVQPRSGVLRLIEEAHAAGLKIGFASTSAGINVSTMLAAVFGPEARFEVGAVVHARMVHRLKPAPDVYELLMSMLRVPAEGCVAIEDSANGVAAAHAAGVFVVATPSRWTAHQDFSRANIILPMLGDPGRGLVRQDAARIGGSPWVGLREILALRREAGGDSGVSHARSP